MPSPGRISELSFKSMPDLFVPLRFFLTAPWFGVLASLLFLFYGDSLLVSRWASELLAMTHLLTIGFMLMSMSGALFQFLPIISGFSIPNSKKISPFIHLFLTLGSLFLGAGFLFQSSLFFQLAFVLLLVAVSLFAGSLTYLLFSIKNNKVVIFTLQLADFALLITLIQGLFMALSYAFPSMNFYSRLFTDPHMLWGGLTWPILLVMSVSSQIIPMFYVTTVFEQKYLKGLSIGLIVCSIFITTVDLLAVAKTAQIIFEIILSLLIAFFSFYILNIINQRKRKLKDMTIYFWKLSLFMPILGIIIYWLNFMIPMLMNNKLEILIGIIFIYGFAISGIIGMMQKIVPFIIFINLQQRIMSHPDKMHLLPNMQTLITVKSQQIQFYLYLISLLFLIMSLFISEWTIIAALLILANFSWLSFQMIQSVNKFHKINKAVCAE